jgi:hypothetical protein
MSDSTRTSPVQRYLKSPFNGEAWPVPPDVNAAMYAALLQAGFTEIPATPETTAKKEKRGPDRAA